MGEKGIHDGHRVRLRSKALEAGLDKLAEHEVLELMLSFVIPYKDTNPIAHKLIDYFGSLSQVLDADVQSLMKIKGIGEKTAEFLALQKGFYQVISKNASSKISSINNTRDVVNYVYNFMSVSAIEELYVICLDVKNHVLNCKKLFTGSFNKANVNMAELTKFIMSNNSHNFILCHNHPKGNCKPSREDDAFTKAVAISMAINGIHLLDHVVIGEDGYYSYNMQGDLERYEQDYKHILSSNVIRQPRCKYNNK